MPSYAYRAVHASGRVSRGEMAAANENELMHALKESGLELIDAHQKNKNILSFSFFENKIQPRMLATFCSRIHDLLASGISFPDALYDIQTSIECRALADALTQISQSIANGKGIAASFALFPEIFTPVFISIISAGEKSGDMTATFGSLSRITTSNAETRERMRRALRYPLFLFFVAGGAVAFMMTMVVPQIVLFLNGIEGHLPLATRILISISAFVGDYGFYFLVSLLVGVLALTIARKIYPTFALIFDGLLLRLPVVGDVIAKTDIARFSHSFSVLFRSGCPAADCLRQAGDTLSNRALRANVDKAEQNVLAGASLSRALENILPPFAVGILRTGERSGNLCKSLDDIAIAYDREAAAAVDSFIGMLEPGLTLLIGGILTWTVLAVIGPLYGSLSVLGGHM